MYNSQLSYISQIETKKPEIQYLKLIENNKKKLKDIIRIDFLYSKDTVWPNFRIKNLPLEIWKLGHKLHQICLIFSENWNQTVIDNGNIIIYYINLKKIIKSSDNLDFHNIYEYNYNDNLRKEVVKQIENIIKVVNPDIIEVVDNAFKIWEDLKELTNIPIVIFLAMYNFTFKYLSQVLNIPYKQFIDDFKKTIINYDDIWALSDFFGNYTKEECNLPKRIDIKTRYNWVISEEFKVKWKFFYELQEKFGKYKHKIWTLSRIDPEKGIHNLITSLSLINNKLWDDFILLVWWDSVFYPEYMNILKYIAKQQEIEENIVFLWHLKWQKKIDFLQFLDLYIFPTICPESWAITILESLACWTPCLVSNNWVWPEYINENVWKVFDTFDTKDFSEKILKCLDTNFSESKIRKYLNKNYTRQNSWKATISHIENLLENNQNEHEQ